MTRKSDKVYQVVIDGGYFYRRKPEPSHYVSPTESVIDEGLTYDEAVGAIRDLKVARRVMGS